MQLNILLFRPLNCLLNTAKTCGLLIPVQGRTT